MKRSPMPELEGNLLKGLFMFFTGQTFPVMSSFKECTLHVNSDHLILPEQRYMLTQKLPSTDIFPTS